MSEGILKAALIIVGAIHCLPVAGLLGRAQLESLYGISAVDPTMILLLQHRAVLFGLLGAFLLIAAFRPGLRSLAIAAGLVAVVSFLALVALSADAHPSLSQVVIADLVALVSLVVATVVFVLLRRSRTPAA